MTQSDRALLQDALRRVFQGLGFLVERPASGAGEATFALTHHACVILISVQCTEPFWSAG